MRSSCCSGRLGAGKGTQGERLAESLRIPKISTGDILRAAVNEGTRLGLEAKGFMDRGALVPDAVILGIMKEALASAGAARGAILDGVVRTVPQAEGLQRLLGELGRPLTAVILFEISDDELVRRISGRTVCDRCQTPYTGLEPGTRCPKSAAARWCGAATTNQMRCAIDCSVYQTQTAPVLNWYESHGVPVVRVNAVGTLDEVAARVTAGLQKLGIGN